MKIGTSNFEKIHVYPHSVRVYYIFFKVWFFPIFRTFSKSKQKLPFVNIQFITTEGFLADLPPSEVVLCMNFSKTSQHFHLHFSRKTSEK